jgi:hypothetical protein
MDQVLDKRESVESTNRGYDRFIAKLLRKAEDPASIGLTAADVEAVYEAILGRHPESAAVVQ